MKKEEIKIKLIGILFILIGLAAIILHITNKDYGETIWFCYIGLILLGIGFIKKNNLLIESQLNILAIPLIIWTIDFIYLLIFKKPLLNITNYFFTSKTILHKIISIQHLITIPLAFYLLKYFKKKTNSIYFSTIQIIILFLITKISTLKNINWVYHTSLNINIPFYPLFWFIAMFLMILLGNKLIRIFKHNNA